MNSISFTVDSSLLRELGERLVGQPHIALAELVKNSYDADATQVTIRFIKDRIEVEDDGHGMTFDDFRERWMRVGTPRKQIEQLSPRFKRPMTGSKGVGRLSVQFLATGLELRTVSKVDTGTELRATVDWGQAIEAGELTQAEALYELRLPHPPFTNGPGTLIVLSGLNQTWESERLEELARQIWPLQPPLSFSTKREREAIGAFVVNLEAEGHSELAEGFERQMAAVLDLWHARLRGQLRHDEEGPVVDLVLEFDDGSREQVMYRTEDDRLDTAAFDIRVFELHHRQRYGIRVEDARSYLRRNGGVHVYDSGFHLPYYGADTDWLDVEADHAKRLSRSTLLPEQLQVAGGMSHLPSNSRIWGVVRVDTSHEREDGHGPAINRLGIQVSRDRLLDNAAYRQLRQIARWSLDFYAVNQARRVFSAEARTRAIRPVVVSSANDLLSEFAESIPKAVLEPLRSHLAKVVDEVRTESDSLAQYAGLLGALATAGMAGLALEHEISKQFDLLESLSKRLQSSDRDPQEFLELGEEIEKWIKRARGSQRLFSHLVNAEDRETRDRIEAILLVSDVTEQTSPLLRGTEVDLSGIAREVLLPEGRVAEWTAIFQNAYFNAYDAMLDQPVRNLRVRTVVQDKRRAVVIDDTGVGVDLSNAENLFEPFVRRLEVSRDRRRLQIGSSGLGLTIMRMIAGALGCSIRFIEAESGFSTSLEIAWDEL